MINKIRAQTLKLQKIKEKEESLSNALYFLELAKNELDKEYVRDRTLFNRSPLWHWFLDSTGIRPNKYLEKQYQKRKGYE